MKCEQVQERLSEYLEGRLDPGHNMAMRDHLASCARCQAEAEALDQTIRSVANLPPLEPPPGLSQRVMGRIREEAEQPGLWKRLFFPIRIKIPIHVTALLIIGGLAVYLYQAIQPLQKEAARPMPSESSPAPPSASPEARLKAVDEIRKEKSRVDVAPSETPPAKNLPKQEGFGGRAGDAAAGKELKSGEMQRAQRAPASAGAPPGTAPGLTAPQTAEPVQYELTFAPKEPQEGMKVLAPKLEALVKQVGGEYLQPAETSDRLKRNLLLESQTVWLVIPEDRYGQFKADLSSLGKIESEVKAVAPSPPRPSVEASSVLRIKLTIRPTEKP